MREIKLRLENMPGTEAAVGWAGSHTVVADRPEGVAGGRGLGFNGAELLGLALGGCFCNDLRYVSHKLNVEIESISVEVTVSLDGDPIIATGLDLSVSCVGKDGSNMQAIIDEAKRICMVRNSLTKGVAVSVNSA